MSTHAFLANPIWNSLVTEHAQLAQGDDRARRYPPYVGPLSGIREPSPECYEALAPLAIETPVVLFDPAPIRPPDGWKILRRGPIVQMLRPAHATNLGDPVLAFMRSESSTRSGAQSIEADSLRPWLGDHEPGLRQLTPDDAPAMVALAELTEPGPFRLRTMELGNFYGIFHGDQLVSMAGKRLHLPDMTEVSGVCTHPDARGRGYARKLMSIVIDEIERDGKQAFLHALAENPAIRLYEQLGFALSHEFDFAVLIHEAGSEASAQERIH
jgi:GNAT superfamily N-acetyltransferase